MRDKLINYIAIREDRYEKLRNDYAHAIEEAIADYGSAAELSRALGENERYVANSLNSSGNGSGMRTRRALALRIAELYRAKNLEHAETGSGSD